MSSQSVGSIHYELGLDTSKFDAAQNQVKSKLAEFQSRAEAAAIPLAALSAAIIAVGVTSVQAFSESQDMIAQTQAVLKSTGGVAGITADKVTELASALQSSTKFSDEQVRSAENMLLTFTSIGKDVFPQATSTVLDMATALGEDTKSASIQLGKALQDPVNGVTALRRVGVNFNDAQQQVIQNMVDTGQQAEAQKYILAELAKEFGGSAQAAGGTFSGALAKLANQFNDVQEAIGGMIVQGLTPMLNWINQALDKVGGMTGAFQMLMDKLSPLKPLLPVIAGMIGGLLVAALVAATAALAPFVIAAASFAWPFVAAGAAVTALGIGVNWLAEKLGGWQKIMAAVKPVIDAVTSTIKQLWQNLVQALQPAIAFISQHMDFFKGVLIALIIGAIAPLVIAVGTIVAAIMAVIFVVTQVINFFNWLIQTVTTVGAAIYNTLVPPILTVMTYIQNFMNFWFTIWNAIAQITFTIISTIVQIVLVPFQALFNWLWGAFLSPVYNAFVGIFSAISGFVRGVIGGLVGWLGGMLNAARDNIVRPIADAYNQVRGWIDGFVNSGRDIINGLIRGIQNGAGGVVDTIKNICRNSLDAVKRFFGISSPSKLMAKQGNFIMQGMGVGLEQGTKAAMASARDSMAMVSEQMNGAANLDTVLSASVRPNSAALAAQNLQSGGASVNTYVYGDTILNGETDQQAYLDRLARNFESVTRGAAV